MVFHQQAARTPVAAPRQRHENADHIELHFLFVRKPRLKLWRKAILVNSEFVTDILHVRFGRIIDRPGQHERFAIDRAAKCGGRQRIHNVGRRSDAEMQFDLILA